MSGKVAGLANRRPKMLSDCNGIRLLNLLDDIKASGLRLEWSHGDAQCHGDTRQVHRALPRLKALRSGLRLVLSPPPAAKGVRWDRYDKRKSFDGLTAFRYEDDNGTRWLLTFERNCVRWQSAYDVEADCELDERATGLHWSEICAPPG